MTPVHAPTPPRVPRTPGDVVRGLLAVIALVAFVIGVPAALRVVAPMTWPQAWPNWQTIVDAVARPDDGSLLLGAITLIAWVAWASFTVSVIAELTASARHLSVPRLPLLGGPQRLAATLVTAAGLLLASTVPMTSPASAATTTTALAPASPTVAQPSSTSSTQRGTATQLEVAADHRPALTATGPVVTVARGDTLWGLAERHLGDGQRYSEIIDLNLGHPQPDGSALTDAHWLYPGWQLHLPLDATELPQATTVPGSATVASATSHGSHAVVPGDTLWDIAATTLGDPTRYPEIVALNRGVPQADGQTLTDSDVIEPGWTLALPDDAPVASPAAEASMLADDGKAMPTAHDAPAPIANANDAANDARPPSDSPAAVASDAPGLTDDGRALGDDARRGADDGQNAASVAAPGSPATVDDANPRESAQALYFGLTALAAAGVIGELSRRRMLQHRTRRVGQRIALPAADSPAADAERTLRAATPTVTIPALKQALLNLASRCYEAERDLPRLAAITLSPDLVTLHLTYEDTGPVAPFATADPHTWTATPAALVADPMIDDPDRPEPFPALVTLGHSTNGTVLLNLEAAGTLTLTGDGDAPADVLRALVAELATSDLTGRIGLIADPQFAALARACDPARLQVATHASIADQLTRRTAAIHQALSGAGTDDTLQARSDRVVGDVWLPVVYVTPTRPGTAPWSGSTVIGIGGAAPEGWTLHHDGDLARLEPLGLTLRPQRLSTRNLDVLIDLLETASPATDEAAATQVTVEDEIVDALAALPVDIAPIVAPGSQVRINVLGPIAVDGLGAGERLSRRSNELLVYLALRGQATGPELDEALWHGLRIENQTRNSLVYRTRQRVGPDVLPTIDASGIYRLGDTVTCDWTQFQALTQRGLAAGPAGIADLQAALDIVRDRPLLGIPDSAYTWAEYDIQHMISTISDMAHVLARLQQQRGARRAALETATKGLLVDSCSDVLHIDALDAANALDDQVEVARLVSRYQSELGALDPDLV
jgi:nucleoid-associated protein YgaU